MTDDGGDAELQQLRADTYRLTTVLTEKMLKVVEQVQLEESTESEFVPVACLLAGYCSATLVLQVVTQLAKRAGVPVPEEALLREVQAVALHSLQRPEFLS